MTLDGKGLIEWIGRNPVTQGFGLSPLGYWLIGGLLLRGAIAWFLPPGFDEAYYYLYTRHLDWSYFDHPLLVALTTGIGPWLTGNVSGFTIRLGSLLLYTGSLWLLYQTGRRLFSATAGLLTIAIASLVPIFFVGFGVMTLPDSPLIFFWSATLYVVSREFFPPNGAAAPQPYRPTARLALIGLLVGLACLSKYHGVFLGLGLLGFCLTHRQGWTALRSPWMLAAVGGFLLAIAPILIWNHQHDWISLRYQSGRALPAQGYNLLELLGTFLISVAYLFPTFGFPLWWVSLDNWLRPNPFTVRQQFDNRGKSVLQSVSIPAPRTLLLWVSLPLMLGFTLMGGYRPILPTWIMPGCWGVTLLLAERATHWGDRTLQRWLGGSAIAIFTLIAIALLHLNLGILQQPGQSALFGGSIPVSADASVQLLDVRQLRQRLASDPAAQAALTTADFVFTSELFLSGQVAMAIAPLRDLPVTCLDQDLRGFAFWSTPEQWLGQTGLYFMSQRRSQQRRSPITQYQPYFSQIRWIADLPLQRGGAIVDVIQVYECQTLLKPYPRPYGNA